MDAIDEHRERRHAAALRAFGNAAAARLRGRGDHAAAREDGSRNEHLAQCLQLAHERMFAQSQRCRRRLLLLDLRIGEIIVERIREDLDRNRCVREGGRDLG